MDKIEQELERQLVSHLPVYRLHHPAPAYVLAFVKTARGDISAGRELLRNAIRSEEQDLWPLLDVAFEKARAQSEKL